MQTFTRTDMTHQVIQSLGSDADDFDVEKIVDMLQFHFGTVDIDIIDDYKYWAIVSLYIKSSVLMDKHAPYTPACIPVSISGGAGPKY